MPERSAEPNSLALVTVVRNEERFMPHFLGYHHAMGVSRAYVYLDRCNDDTESICRRYPWVRTFRIEMDETHRPSHHADMQALCMNDALRRAREEGHAWLLAIDADEFATLEDEPSPLPASLATVPDSIEVIRLAACETVPADLPPDTPFWQQRFFQEGEALVREIRDFRTGETRKVTAFLGQSDGKSIIRTSANAQAWDPHQWVWNQERFPPERPEYVPLEALWRGRVYHYAITSADHWREKYGRFRNEAPVLWNGSLIPFPRDCWNETVSELPGAEAESYFRDWIAMPETDLIALAREGKIRELPRLGEVIASYGDLPDAAESNPAIPFHPLSENRPPEKNPHCIDPATVNPKDLRGFHALERAGDRAFRWAAPECSVLLHLSPGNYTLRIDLGPMGGIVSRAPEIGINQKGLSPSRISIEGNTVVAKLRREDFDSAPTCWLHMNWVEIDTSPWPHPDPRTLGAPFFGITLEPERESLWQRIVGRSDPRPEKAPAHSPAEVVESEQAPPVPGDPTCRIDLSREETESGTLTPEHLERAAEMVRERGYVILGNAFPETLLDQVDQSFDEVLQDCRTSHDGSEDFQYSGRSRALFFARAERWRVFPRLTPPFSDPLLVANPMALAIMRALRDTGWICQFVSSDTCLENSKTQAPHSDVTDLASDCQALIANIPLSDCSREDGPTEVWPCGSHLWNPGELEEKGIPSAIQDGENQKAEEYAAQFPSELLILKRGDLVLRDPAMWHRGTPNRTSHPRRILTLQYRSQVAETSYGHPRYNLDYRTFKNLAPEVKPLFSFAFPPPDSTAS